MTVLVGCGQRSGVERNFSGGKISAEWRLYPNIQKKEFDVTNDFVSGRYTRVELVASPAKAEDLKYLSIGVTFNELSIGVPLN